MGENGGEDQNPGFISAHFRPPATNISLGKPISSTIRIGVHPVNPILIEKIQVLPADARWRFKI
jgi:hypothetical protein